MIDTATLTGLYAAARTRILDGVDLQGDFMWRHGALGIHPANGSKENAELLIPRIDAFLAAVQPGCFDLALLKFDTHFPGEYPHSPEAQLFPAIHCAFGTPGWQLAVDVAPLVRSTPTYLMAKNEFDMWGSNPVGVPQDQIAFADVCEANAYDHLFTVIPLRSGDQPKVNLIAGGGVPRDAFLADKIGPGTVVTLLGVASDFCDHQALLGYLQRGATVIVAEDLTAGIGGPGSPVPATGAMRDVIAATLATYPATHGRLFAAPPAAILDSLNAATYQPHPTRGTASRRTGDRYDV